MPVERSAGHSGKALIIAGVGIALAFAVAFGIAVLDNRGDVDIRPGVDEQRLGKAESLAEDIAEGGPAWFPDPSGHDRPLYLQHLGEEADEGWIALAARPPGAAEDCMLEWQAEASEFRLLDDGKVTEDCDGTEYAADGGDLPTFEVTIREGTVFVDPRSDER